MNITGFALDNSRTVVFSTLLVVAAGLFLFTGFPRLEDPSIIIREAVVVARFPGMPPERVERLITRPIEEKLRSLGEVDDIWSTSKRGDALIHVSIRDEVPAEELSATWKLIRNRMTDLMPSLPAGTRGPTVNDQVGDTAVVTVALLGEGFSMAEMLETARNTRERLAAMRGIKKVELYGAQEERVYLETSNAKLSQLGISTRTIADTLKKQNVLLPGGKMDIEGEIFTIETSGNFDDVSEIGSLLISVPGTDKTIPLRDILRIRRGYADPPVKPAYFNGEQCIIFSVVLLDGLNAVRFGTDLTVKLREIEQTLPIGYRFEYATYQPDLIEKAVNGAVSNVVQTLVIVLIVVMVFLGGRTGIIVGSFVPMVMLMGLVIMRLWGIDMQRMSIASMIIALGMLVDNGIVVAEDIRTRMEAGTSPREACLEAGQTLSVPLLTSTLTTVLAFAPMMLTIGSTGDYVKSLGQVVIILLLASWFLSMYLTPSSCNWFMKAGHSGEGEKESGDPYQGKFYRIYRGLLERALRNRILLIAGVAGILMASFYAFTFVPQAFFPDGDRNQFLVYIDLPAGKRIEQTAAEVQEISTWLRNRTINPEITGTVGYAGSGGPRFFLSLSPDDPDDNNGFIIVNTENGGQVEALVARTRKYILENHPNVRGRVMAMWLGSSEPGMMEVRLSGPGIDTLLDQAEKLMGALRAVPGTLNLRQDWNNRVVKIGVRVDQARARRAGLTSAEVAESLDAFIDGVHITDFRSGDTIIPVMARGIAEERKSLSYLPSISIYSNVTKKNVPLSQVADIYGVGELQRIERYNQERCITVSAKNPNMSAGELFAAVRPMLEEMEFPPGHFWEAGGELEDSGEAKANLFRWMPACLLLMVGLLVWQFNSFRRAGIILITIPLIFIGAVIGLLVMRADFGFMVILGLLSLAGTLINNGIVLIDKIESQRETGMENYRAIVSASISRFRPILMSVTTTVLGLMPLIVSRDPLFYGMACVMAWGLAVGTVFTLGVVPVLYSLFFRIRPPRQSDAENA